MATLLSLIGENERFRIKPKNLPPTDDVTENGLSSYLDDYGTVALQDYTNDTNVESPSVSDIGAIAIADRKDYNVFPQDVYNEAEVERIDVSVIDMPSIEDISDDIYLSNAVYNKYANLEYIPFEVQDAVGVQNQSESYGDYIQEILSNLEQRGNSLADIFIGQFNKDDSPIGVIGGESLFKALQNQFKDGVERKVFSIVNKSLLNILDGGELIRQDYNITTGKTFLGRAAEFAAKLVGLENPISYLPEDAFNFNRPRVITNGKVTYTGSGLSYSEQVNLMLDYTGLGQQKQLLSLLEMNIYHDKIEGRKKTLNAELYIPYTHFSPKSLNTKNFIVAETNATGEYFEPYGVVSRHRNNEGSIGGIDKQIFSDGFWFQWTFDSKKESIGWIKRNNNPFRDSPQSLLFKTQELLKENSNIGAFLDLSEKSFVEVIDGETRVISRSDGTTASATKEYDDGTTIQAGDYFRVWTKERGYNRLSRALRHRALDNGDKRSVLNDNGIPNYAPTTRTTTRNGITTDDVIKRYMFSLENLAWNDHMDDLPECEQGAGDPLTGTRGRIMWFPPYNLEFDENVSVDWNPQQFIGRGEKIYTYNNTERTGKISFSILVDHPDIIHLKELQGAKTQYWERYFKGDKAVEEDAIDKYNKQKKISQNELDALNVIKKPIPPKYKKVTKTIKTVKRVEQEKKIEVKKKEEKGKDGYGELILSIYFANNEITVPRSTFVPNLTSTEPDSIPDKNINFSEMTFKNIGYEDGGKADGFISSDKYTINTSTGLQYKDSKGVIVNKGGRTTQATYNYSVINTYTISDCKVVNEAFQDTTNFNLNKEFYFEWQKKFSDAISGKSKVQVSFIGNASKPKAAENTTNTALSQGRANNAAFWFNMNVKKLLTNLNLNVEFVKPVITYKSDQEDTDKAASGAPAGTFCGICDRPFLEPCKKSRRVDIYIKDLSPADAEPNPQPETSVDTIEEVQTLEEYILDTDEGNTDPNNDTTPDIDESVIKKLIYTECDFFKYLEINDPIAYQTISEKIKYFTPAFHSITPQGFNSRLTFLHQCTRQGESIGLDGVDNVKNLAFGRPPVCILRIGDFFHTKIVIDSVNIVYKNNNIMWDLNPEGIGVQPMYADISLGIKILGGMSMTAPINRLQNALSFNFYANTEMYDARADSVVFQQQFNSEGALDNNATYGTPKAAKIVDGIKLSSLIKISDAKRQEKLAKLRQDSRFTLSNSTDAVVPTDQIGTLGTVESILEFKKRAGLPLTEKEKINKKIEDETKDKFQLTNLDSKDSSNIKTTMTESMKAENSLLNQQSKEIFKSALNPKNPDDVAKVNDLLVDINQALRATNETNPYNSKFPESMEKLKVFTESINQYSQGSIGNPSEFTEENKNNTAEEYLNAFQNVWINKTGKGGFIKL
jgi:hypothetical protein